MQDPTPHEIDAMTDAGAKGGEYLDAIKKTDFAAMSADEFGMFVESVVTGFCDSMRLRASMTMKPIKVDASGFELS